MNSEIQNNHGKAKAFLILFGALLFNLSGLPGFRSEAKVFSSDLLSVDCDLQGQILENGKKAECKDLKQNNIGGSYKVEVIHRKKTSEPKETDETTETEAEGTPLDKPLYKITSTLDCAKCFGKTGIATRTIDDFKQLREVADNLFAEQTEEAAKLKKAEEELAEKKRTCLVDAKGTEIKSEKNRFDCRILKLSAMSDEDAGTYYDETMKDRLQALMESGNDKDREFAMRVLGKLGDKMDISCPTQPQINSGLAASNPFFSNASSVRMQSDDSAPTEGKGYVKSSACDLYTYGRYTKSLAYLNTQLAVTSDIEDQKKLAAQTIALRKSWGSYFEQRRIGMVNNPGLTFNRGDLLATDLAASNARFNASLAAIVEQHAEILQNSTATPSVTTATPAGRFVRGGNIIVDPNAAVNAVNSKATPAMVVGSPIMKVIENPGPYRGAPQLGTPVGQ